MYHRRPTVANRRHQDYPFRIPRFRISPRSRRISLVPAVPCHLERRSRDLVTTLTTVSSNLIGTFASPKHPLSSFLCSWLWLHALHMLFLSSGLAYYACHLCA